MDSFVRYFEISNQSLICALTTQEAINELDKFLSIEQKALSELKESDIEVIYRINPKNLQKNSPILIFSTFSDLISLRIILLLKNLFSNHEYFSPHCCIMLFLPVSNDSKINLEILDKVISLESEEQISEILNMEYRESAKLLENRKLEFQKFKRISDLYNKLQSVPTKQRNDYLTKFDDFKNHPDPILSLHFQYLNFLFGQPSAGIFCSIETFPFIITGSGTYNGIPKGQSIERFLKKLLE